MNPREWGRKGGMAAYGQRKASAKLTDDLVRMIRTSAEPCSHLARTLGVGETTVQYARLGKTWRHVQ